MYETTTFTKEVLSRYCVLEREQVGQHSLPSLFMERITAGRNMIMRHPGAEVRND